MRTTKYSLLAGLSVVGVLLVGACGSSDGDDTASDPAPTEVAITEATGATATTAAPDATAVADGEADVTASEATTGAPDATIGATATTAAETDRGPGPAPTEIDAGLGSAQADGVFPRTVAHYKGETVIEAEPTRIVVIGTGQLDGVLTLGVVPVGAVQRTGAEIVQPYLIEAFPEYSEQLAEIESGGTNAAINFEAIAAMNPDLIFDNGGGSAEEYDTLAAIAPTVITAGTGVNWKKDFLLIAAALGRTDAADAVMDAYNSATASLASSVAADPPTVSFTRFNSDRARIFGIPSFAGSIAWDAGLDRPASQQFDKTSEDLSEEMIPEIDADWVFYSIQGTAADTPVAEEYLSNPLWSTLSAVQDGHLVQVEDDPWYLSAGPTAAMIVVSGLQATIVGS